MIVEIIVKLLMMMMMVMMTIIRIIVMTMVYNDYDRVVYDDNDYSDNDGYVYNYLSFFGIVLQLKVCITVSTINK